MVTRKTGAGEGFRQRAEKLTKDSGVLMEEYLLQYPGEDAGRLLHELRVYQIELEMQNDELRVSQQELEASRARYQELYNFAPIGYLSIGNKGLIAKANFAFANLLAAPMNTLIKRPFTRFVFSEDQDTYYLWNKKVSESVETHGCELRLLRNGNSPVWVRLVANLARDSAGAAGMRVAVSDISESKKIKEELALANLKIEEASRSKSVFLANMSHELRTPLNSIIGFSEVLKDKLFGPLNEKQDTFISNILHSGQHLLSLINDILDISKVEANKMELELGMVNLEEVCQGTVAMFSEKARSLQVELSYVIDSGMDSVFITADGRKIKQILYNLVDNGIKFNRTDGFVAVTIQKASASFSPAAVEIVVEDGGIGIAEEDQQKLFLPFSQLAQSYYDKKTEGTGLGLALSKHLVELHGGTITLRSKFGKGCQFIILLPINQEQQGKES